MIQSLTSTQRTLICRGQGGIQCNIIRDLSHDCRSINQSINQSIIQSITKAKTNIHTLDPKTRALSNKFFDQIQKMDREMSNDDSVHVKYKVEEMVKRKEREGERKKDDLQILSDQIPSLILGCD